MNTTSLRMGLLLIACIGVTACGEGSPPPSATLDSGVTADNGGGQRALGDLPNVGITDGKTIVKTMAREPRLPKY